MSRSRNFCFTWNNYDDVNVELVLNLVNPAENKICQLAQYVCVGKEKAPTTGTPHLQGFIHFAQPQGLKRIQNVFNPAHVEICKGTAEQNIRYCKKEDDWLERGHPPMTQKEKGEKGGEYWEEILASARADDMEAIPAQALIQHGSALRYYRDEESKKRKFEDSEDQMLWYYGESGTGKSRKAREDHPEAYLKMCNKWWDGYEHHEVVLIEDLDVKHECLAHHLKLWADRYPFLAEYKGGAKKIRPKLIIVTSNWHPSDIWRDDRDLKPILRRFKTVKFSTLT